MKWLLQILNFYRLHKIYANAEFDRALQELRILQYDFNIARKFLKRNYAKRKLPIYLIIGPNKFGKSTLLANSGLNLIDTNHQQLINIAPTKYCNWWFAKDAIYIDTAGIYSSQEKNEFHYKIVWMSFLKLLKKYFFTNSISGVFLTIDIPTLYGPKEQLNKIINDLRERIYEISKYTIKLPIFIALTKTDLLAGFKDTTFPLGINFNNESIYNNPIHNFNNEFDSLLKHLQQTNSTELQFALEDLRNNIIDVISTIPIGGHINLAALYFTNKIYSNSTEDLFNKTAIYSLNNVIADQISWLQFTTIAATAFLVIIPCLIFYQSYINATYAINISQNAINHYQKTGDRSQLLQASTLLKPYFGFNQPTQVNNNLKQLIYHVTEPSFLLQLQKTIENELNYVNNNQYTLMYNGLKAYLMLSDPSKSDPEFIQNWFKSYLEKTIPNDKFKQQQLELELSIALEHALPKLNPEQQIINNIRNKLNSSPQLQGENVFAILEKNHARENLQFSFGDNKIIIPKIYTLDYFNKISQHEISDAIHNLSHKKSDWVLNTSETDIPADTALKIAADAKSIYIKKYIAIWKNTIFDLKVDNFIDVKHAAKFILALHKDHNQLISLIKSIKVNTDTPEFADNFKTFAAIDTKELAKQLSNLNNYFDDFVSGDKTDKNAYNYLLANFQTQSSAKSKNAIDNLYDFALKQPEPLRQLLVSLVDNSWQAIFNSSQNYLNQIWAQTVLPFYEKHLANNFPLVTDAQVFVSVENFSKFFGPYGIVDQYFSTYLKPFVDTNEVYWHWKKFNGRQLNISQETLEMFIRAALIQKMYFPNDAKNIAANFTLIPKELSPNTKSFTLNLEGQTLTFDRNSKKSAQWTWRALPQSGVSLEFTNNSGKHFINNLENSPWSWLKLLNKSSFHTLNNSERYDLTFDLNGNAAKFQLIAEQPVNPFIPEIINNFRCPPKL